MNDILWSVYVAHRSIGGLTVSYLAISSWILCTGLASVCLGARGMSNKLLQYVILRKDLVSTKKSAVSFSMGANVAQACHAATAAIVKSFHAPSTVEYLSLLEDMTLCVLSVQDGQELEEIGRMLKTNAVAFHLWVEQPEGISTALATAPMPRDQIAPLLSHLKLLR